jgi:hypothetical protein
MNEKQFKNFVFSPEGVPRPPNHFPTSFYHPSIAQESLL